MDRKVLVLLIIAIIFVAGITAFYFTGIVGQEQPSDNDGEQPSPPTDDGEQPSPPNGNTNQTNDQQALTVEELYQRAQEGKIEQNEVVRVKGTISWMDRYWTTDAVDIILENKTWCHFPEETADTVPDELKIEDKVLVEGSYWGFDAKDRVYLKKCSMVSPK